MNITIEYLQLPELIAFLREQADDTFPSLKDESRLNLLAEKWHTHAEFCTCRDEKGRLIGMIAFYANQPDSEVAYIPHVYVASQFRCKGIFKKMLHVVEYRIRVRGYHIIKLEVQNDNNIALLSYERIGFSMSGIASTKSAFLTKSL